MKMYVYMHTESILAEPKHPQKHHGSRCAEALFRAPKQAQAAGRVWRRGSFLRCVSLPKEAMINLIRIVEPYQVGFLILAIVIVSTSLHKSMPSVSTQHIDSSSHSRTHKA